MPKARTADTDDPDAPVPKRQRKDKPEHPYTISDAERIWALTEEHYKAFYKAVGPRGNRSGENAKSWAHKTLTPLFEKQFWSSWDLERREKYRPGLQYSLYNLFNNNPSESAKEVRRQTQAQSVGAKPKRVFAGNIWANEHKVEVQAAINEYLDENPHKLRDPGTTRHVICDLWKNLPEEERLIWEGKADETRALLAEEGKLTGKARDVYQDMFLQQLNDLVTKGQERAGISFHSLVCWETENDNGQTHYKVNSLSSSDIREFKDTREFSDGTEQFSNWLRDHKSKSVEGCDPPIAVTPDKANGGLPLMPELPEKPRVGLVRTLNRQFLKATYAANGGTGPPPYSDISADSMRGKLHLWFEPSRWPEGLEFKDPSRMKAEESMVLYNHCRLRQDGGPETSLISFKRVYAGSGVPPESALIADKTLVNYGGRRVWMLELRGYIGKLQPNKAIPFGPESWTYLHWLNGKDLAHLLEHWEGLPSVSQACVEAPFSQEEIEHIGSMFESKPELHQKVLKLTGLINGIEQHSPVTIPDGIWHRSASMSELEAATARVPSLLPAARPSNLQEAGISFLRDDPFVPPTYCKTRYELKQSGELEHVSKDHFETWLEHMRRKGLIHSRSGTVAGGLDGVVWLARALFKALYSAAVPAIDLVPISPPPDHLNLEEFSKGFYGLLETNLDAWIDICTRSMTKLAASSAERVHVSDTEPQLDIGDDSEDGAEDRDRLQPTPKPKKPTKGGSVKKPRKSTQPKKRAHEELDEEDEAVTTETDASDDEAHALPRPRPINQFPPLSFEPQPIPDKLDDSVETTPFGRFDGREMTFAPFEGSSEKLVEKCDASIARSKKAVQAWLDAGVGYDRYSSIVFRRAEELASEAPEELRPLIATLWMHRCDWNQSMAMWPEIRKHHWEMLNSFRETVRLIGDVESCIDVVPHGPRTNASLKLKIGPLTAHSLCLRLIFETLRDLGRLSNRWAVILKYGWNLNLNTMSTAEVHHYSVGLYEWINEAYTTTTKVRRTINDLWTASKYTLSNFQQLPKEVWYRFGCPSGEMLSSHANTLMEGLYRQALAAQDARDLARRKRKEQKAAQSSVDQGVDNTTAQSTLETMSAMRLALQVQANQDVTHAGKEHEAEVTTELVSSDGPRQDDHTSLSTNEKTVDPGSSMLSNNETTVTLQVTSPDKSPLPDKVSVPPGEVENQEVADTHENTVGPTTRQLRDRKNGPADKQGVKQLGKQGVKSGACSTVNAAGKAGGKQLANKRNAPSETNGSEGEGSGKGKSATGKRPAARKNTRKKR